MARNEFDPRSLPKEEKVFTPDLNMERSRQIGKYVALSFHLELGKQLGRPISEEEYQASFPDAQPQSEAKEGFPLFVDPRISLAKQCELGDIENAIHRGTIRDFYFDANIAADPQGSIEDIAEVPSKPYMVRVGIKNPNDKEIFRKDVEDSPLIEAIALSLQHSEFFVEEGKSKGQIDAAGSRAKLGGIPGVIVLASEKAFVIWGVGSQRLFRGKEITVAS